MDEKDFELDLSAPWYVFHTQVFKLFEQDAEVIVDEELEETETGFTFGIYSKNAKKIQAIKKLIGSKVVFGNVAVEIDYGENEDEDIAEIWKDAFSGNPLFCGIVSADMPFYGSCDYAIFKRDIIDFYGDDISDVNGNLHYIVADLVKEVVNSKGIFICTEGKDE